MIMNKERKSKIVEYANAHPICTLLIGLSVICNFRSIINAFSLSKNDGTKTNSNLFENEEVRDPYYQL